MAKERDKDKAKEVFVRLGVADYIITKEEHDSDEEMQFEDTEVYFIGYEDEYGNECEEDGTYL